MTLLDMLVLYKTMTSSDNLLALFHDIELDSRLDKTLLTETIIQKWGNGFTIARTVEEFKLYSDIWFKKNRENIKKMIDALTSEYNPIENYLRFSEYNKTNDDNLNGEYNDESLISSFNSESYQPSSQNKGKNSKHNDLKEKYNEKTHGNIGVTTNQKMISDEIELRKWNIYDWIVAQWSFELMQGFF